MRVAPVGLTFWCALPGASPCSLHRLRPLALGFWQGWPPRLLAPHRGVSRRLSGSLVFRSIGLILVFGEGPMSGVGDCSYDGLPPGSNVYPLDTHHLLGSTSFSL
jgi:hypothetical protein